MAVRMRLDEDGDRLMTIRAQTGPPCGGPCGPEGCQSDRCLVDIDADEPSTFTGRFLDPELTWLIDPRAEPGPGYAVGPDGRLWRNGEHVGFVLAVTFNRDAGGHWVDYESWAGSPMDRRELGA